MTLRSAGPSRRDAAWALVLALAIAGTWCVSYGRTSRRAWTTPVTYRGDALFLMGYLRAAEQGHVLPAASLEVPELNAPNAANWNDHPRTLRIVFLAAGLVSRVTGLFAAANALLLTAHVLAGLSFFFVARRFAARPEWAAAGGLAFGLSHFLFWRSLDHLDLALGWHIPLCILVATWAASRGGVPPGSRRFVAAVAVCVVAALHNPYYSCLFAQFLLLAALAQAVRPRGRVLDPLLLLGVLVGAFLADNAGSLAYAWSHGANAAAVRPYGNLERFALKPLELFFPPPGYGLADWGRVARAYWEGRIYRGEGGSPYLGLLGAGALAWLAAVSVTRLLRRPAQAPPATAAAIAWIVAFSMLGGVNQFVGMFGFLWLRGTNRFSVWILALVLLFLVTRRLPRGRAGYALAAGAALLAVADQVPRPANRDEIARTARLIAADATFVASLERVLPAARHALHDAAHRVPGGPARARRRRVRAPAALPALPDAALQLRRRQGPAPRVLAARRRGAAGSAHARRARGLRLRGDPAEPPRVSGGRSGPPRADARRRPLRDRRRHERRLRPRPAQPAAGCRESSAPRRAPRAAGRRPPRAARAPEPAPG